MTLPQLLEEAKRLTAEGWMDTAWFAQQAERIKDGAGKAAMTETYVRAYELDLHSVEVDGSTLMLDRATRTHRLLCSAEVDAQRFEAALLQETQALRMEVIRARHKKAMATQKEERA
jgi:hypothetical protein